MTRLRALALAVVVAALVVGAVVWGRHDDSARPRREEAAPEPVARVAPRLDGRVLDTIGVASVNAWLVLGEPGARADWDRVTSNPEIDLIGWQEASSEAWAGLYPRYRARGWETWHRAGADGPEALAVSWRRRVFTLVDAGYVRAHDASPPGASDAPFPVKWVLQVSLRHRASGMLVTVLNTHVNHTVETGHGWEKNLNAVMARRHYRLLTRMLDEAPGDVVMSTGDYNWDYADDTEYHPRGGIGQTVDRRNQSSYEALGLDGVEATLRTRWIDYVWLADRSVRRPDGRGVAQFARHRSLNGFRSDHRPLLAVIRLYATS
ncbi:hypothetical protein LRP67_19665 [Nocardioides sp. cx-169]|uniref:hypothetical protein n=1 Tax=Nocardioides sp. cx-169 TaxID=2899080 RepID=UPI001E4C6939|nr:hypothetical protein [Nocardioides sp. cx-169]MCD4536315.1 hypothetical protein [Nocardioides sp. cx-169]